MTRSMCSMLNDQINEELFSAYLYVYFASILDGNNFSGYAHWFKVQAKEEIEHAMRIYDYLVDNDEKVILYPITVTDDKFETLKDILKGALNHEKYITSRINDLYITARDENDCRTMNFLSWFINEQLEEEKNASDLLSKYELFSQGSNYYELDKDAMSR